MMMILKCNFFSMLSYGLLNHVA